MGRRRIQRCNTMELRDLLLDPAGGRWFRPINSADEVFPGVLLGDADTALSTHELRDLGVTHVLNAAQGHNNPAYNGYVSTNPTYYAKMKNLKFMGIAAMDMPGFYIRPYLSQAADFIHNALKEGGRVLVHCQCGISRSAALVCGFFMLKRGMNVQTALATIKKKRNIFPNQGFLSQLCDLDYELRRSGDLPDKGEPPQLAPIVVDKEREPSPAKNPASYPRFSLVPTKMFDTYTSTKNYVVPRRARSVDRYETPRLSYQDHALVDSRLRDSRSPVRALSPARRSSVTFGTYDDDDIDIEPPKVFDTYRRYARSVTGPLVPPSATYVSTLARPYDPYVSPKTLASRTPKSFYFDDYYYDPNYEYASNLSKYYDSYKYNRTASPFTVAGSTVAPASLYRTYKMLPDRAYLVGTSYTNPSAYPYSEKYIPAVSKYPSTYRTLNHSTLSPLTRVWI